MLIFPDKLKSNNIAEYGIVDLNQTSGARVVPYVENLFQISDALLSTDGNGANSIGQCWFVSDTTSKYYLTNWELRHSISGWTPELLYSIGIGFNQAFQGSRGLALEELVNSLTSSVNNLIGLSYLNEIFYQNEVNQSLDINYGLNVIGTISASTYYNLPIATNSTLGIASFSGSQFNVINGIVSIKSDILGSGGLDEAQLATYLMSHGYATSAKTINYLISGGTAAALDTLNELSAALGNDPNFATTITNVIGTKWTQDNLKIANWDLAFTNNHTHINKSILDSISATTVSNWNTAYTNTHSHLNKSVLDNITSDDIVNWNNAYANTHVHSNYDILSGITAQNLLNQTNIDVLSHLSIVEGKLQIDIDTYSTGELAAYGIGSGSTSGTSGTTGYKRLDLWTSYDPDPNTGTTGYVLSAFLGYDLYNRLNDLTQQTIGAESYLGNPTGNGYLLSSTTNGTRTWVAPYVHPTGVTGTFTKVVTDNYGHVISGITPTTLSDYSISDAYTKTYIDTYLQVKYAGMSLFSGFTTSGNQITLPNSKVRLYSTSNFTGYVQEYNLSQTTFTITSQAVHFIVADYNAGTPIYYLTTNRGIINYSNVTPIVTLLYDGVKIHSVNWDESANGTAERLNKKLNRTDRFKRESGLSISVDAALHITVATGVVWFGVNTVIYPESISTTNNIYRYYHSGGTWVYSRSATLNNTQYDNGTNIATLQNNNRYSVNWVYAGVGDDGDIFTLLGTADYDLAGAINAQPPSSVPDIILFHGILVGKVVYPYNSTTPYSVISITDNITTAGGAILEHSNLNGIQGGLAGEYYHLNSAELASLHNFSDFTSVAGTYTKITTDSKGRVISGITPTTLSGYSITDAVTINTNQTITGSKTFVSGITLSNGVYSVELKINEYGDLFVGGNLHASGDVAAFSAGSTNGSGATLTSLGDLVNVEDNVDEIPAQQYFLFRDSGSTHWSKKLLSDLSVTWSNLDGKPTTLSGYGISVSDTLFDSKYSPSNHTHTSLNLTGLTLTGGITGTSASFTSGITTTTGVFSSGVTASTGFFNNLTNNYVVKQSSSGLTNSIIFDNGTNVGISNPTPTYKLDINGTLRVTGSVLFSNSLVISSGLTVNDITTTKGLVITNGVQSVNLIVDVDGNLRLDNSVSGANFYATGEIAAYGIGSTGGGGGSVNILTPDSLTNVFEYSDISSTFNAYTIKDINTRLVSVETNGATNIFVSGLGNAITGVSKSGNTLTFEKALSFAPSVGSSLITSLGTVTSGVWSASIIDLQHGGTNANLSAIAGGIVYSTSTTMAITQSGTTGYLLTANGTGVPTWTNPAIFSGSGHTHPYLSLSGGTLTGSVSGTSFYGSFIGNASTASKLFSGVTISVSGDGFTTSSASFDGSQNIGLVLDLDIVDGGTW